MFQERFAPKVEDGTKPNTIRPPRKRKIRAGDILDLRAWTGKPYWSEQRKLRTAVCKSVTPITIRFSRGKFYVIVNGVHLFTEQVVALAKRDGFADAIDMLLWFHKTHDLPFKGILIEWTPA